MLLRRQKKKVVENSNASTNDIPTTTSKPTITQNPATTKTHGAPVFSTPPAEAPVVKKTAKVLRIDEIQTQKPIAEKPPKTDEKEIEANVPKNFVPLDEKTLVAQWNSFIADWQEKRLNLTSQMRLFTPKFEDSVISIVVLSNYQENVLRENYDFLKSSLTQIFGTQFSDFKIILTKDDSNAPKKWFTDKEQFQHLATLNPALLQLQRNLDLDFDR